MPFKPGLAHTTNRGSVCGTPANSGCSLSLTEPTNLRLQGVQQAEVLGGVVSLVEDQSRFGDDRRSTGQLAEELMESFQDQRELPGVVAVPFIDVVEQRQLAIGGTEQGVTHLPEVVASLFVLAAGGQATAGVKRIEEGVEVGPIVADRGQVDPLALDDVLDQVLPDGGRRLGFDRIHVIPEALRTQGGPRRGGEASLQHGLGEPVPHRALAARADGSVDRGDRQVLAGGQSLPPFGAVPVNMPNQSGTGGFLPEGLGQSPLEDLGVQMEPARFLGRPRRYLPACRDISARRVGSGCQPIPTWSNSSRYGP